MRRRAGSRPRPARTTAPGSTPTGVEFYAQALRHMTTTELSATQIHEYGLEEVARIHGEMERLKNSLGFGGSRRFFRAHQNKPQTCLSQY
ncbi:DUF885 family protein [Bradyrhizobium sp. CSA112]|nr:DUF885 family protein [Bradyrhizobium sp. CSA112]